MVKFSSDANIDLISNLVYGVFRIQVFFTHMTPINDKGIPCLYAIWHEDLVCLHGMNNRSKLSVMISNSNDGEIIARVVEKWGLRTIRGSQRRKGAVEATKRLITRLQEGEFGAITIDGPHGPVKVVKKGIIKIAQMAKVPIVPVVMYSPYWTLHRLPSWDRMKMPIGYMQAINMLGEPIYVDDAESDEKIEEYRQIIQNKMDELEKIAPQKFKEVFKFGIWKNKNY